MITVIGVIFILFACTAFTMRKILEQRRQIDTARDFVQAFSYLAGKMEFTLEPLPSLLDQAAQEGFGEAGNFFKILAQKLEDGSNKTLREIWKDTLYTYAQRLKLSPQTVRILKHVGSRLGQAASNIEIEILTCAGKELEEEILAREAEFSKNEKLLKSSGILVGILIVIFFL